MKYYSIIVFRCFITVTAYNYIKSCLDIKLYAQTIILFSKAIILLFSKVFKYLLPHAPNDDLTFPYKSILITHEERKKSSQL